MKRIILIVTTLILIFIIGIGTVLIFQNQVTSPNNNVIIAPTAIPISGTSQISPVRPPVLYKNGSIDREVNVINNRQTISSQDTIARKALIQTIGGVSGTLYQSNDYTIDYIKPLDIFEAQIISIDVATAKQGVVSWFESKGISADGICKLPITFYLNRSTAEQLHGSGIIFNPLPEGC